ncbi:phospholipase [Sphingomonas sp. MAH-6]|nr:phospholipase [Sphingomonas chungangi]
MKVACMALLLSSCGHSHNDSSETGGTTPPALSEQDALATATPIKHLVVIFGENESFDHYFGTYPQSANPAGEPVPDSANAPSNVANVNGYIRSASLLTANPNTTSAANIAKASAAGFPASYMNPFRLDRAQFDTSSQNHAYTPEQQATNNLKMDSFVAYTGKGSAGGAGAFGTVAQVMGYFDGNTVTAMWNYAQNFAMSDNAYTDSFGPSTPGAINVISGTTSGADKLIPGDTIADGQGKFTMINDGDPEGDICSTNAAITATMAGKNIGDLLNSAKITWGGFMGGFDLTAKNANGTGGDPTKCTRSTVSPNTNRTVNDYVQHHAWFQYYASTLNPNHSRPSSTAMIGHTETTDGPVDVHSATLSTNKAVNHQYDYNDFVSAVSAGNFPSVSYIKAPAFQDAHPGNSNPLDEQAFVTKVINFLQQQPDWKNTAVIVTYDDSDGWYDHSAPNILNSSFDPTADQMNSAGTCTGPNAKQALDVNGKQVNGRCGPGTRTPFLVISPYAKVNYVSSTPITQSSVVRFIEDNWLNGQRLGGGSNDAIAGNIMDMFDFQSAPHTTPVFLDPTTGKKTSSAPA